MAGKRPIVISNSFTVEQTELLAFITQTMLRGGDPSMAARHKAFPGLAAKIGRMKAKADQKKRERQGGGHGEGAG